MKLLDVLPESRLLLDLKARDKKAAVREIVQYLVDTGAVTDDIGKKIEKAVHKREGEGSTGIGKGLAIPHAKGCSFLTETLAVFARSSEGIDFNAIDGGLVNLIFLVVSPADQADSHLAVMRKIALMHRDEKTLKFFKTTSDVPSVMEILREIDDNFERS